MQKKVYITLHGYKRPGWDEFKSLENSITTDGEIIIFDYYDSTEFEGINRNDWIEAAKDKIREYKDYDVTLIGYSVGAVMALAAAADPSLNNIKKIFAITPAVKTQFMRWILKGVIFPYFLGKKLYKRITLGKKKYNAYKKSRSRGASEVFPMKMTLMINAFKINLKKQFVNIRNKDIEIVYANNDGIVDVERSTKYLEKNLHESNEYKIIFVEESHYRILDEGSTVYNKMQEFIDKDKI